MKISELIKKLQTIQKEHGDLQAVYACDEEGNSFSPVEIDPTEGFYDDDVNDFTSIIDLDSRDKVNAICIN